MCSSLQDLDCSGAVVAAVFSAAPAFSAAALLVAFLAEVLRAEPSNLWSVRTVPPQFLRRRPRLAGSLCNFQRDSLFAEFFTTLPTRKIRQG